MSKLTVSHSRCQCCGCGLFFKSLNAFDKHRTGKHGVDRRCMTQDEMRDTGMATNPAGYWVGSVYDGPSFWGAKAAGNPADDIDDLLGDFDPEDLI